MNVTGEYQLTLEDFIEGTKEKRREYRRTAARERLAPRIFAWTLFAGLGLMLVVYHRQQSAPNPAVVRPLGPTPLQVLSQVWWIMVFGFVGLIVLARYSRRRAYRRAFESSPILHRVRAVQIHDQGIAFSDSVSEFRATWSHYVHFAETQNLFLLFETKYAAELIPKRVFPDETTIREFRQLLARSISGPSGGFPVLPAKPPPP